VLILSNIVFDELDTETQAHSYLSKALNYFDLGAISVRTS